MSKGRINDWISFLIAKASHKVELANQQGVLGDMSNFDYLSRTVSNLKRRGYVVFPSALSPELCDKLTELTRIIPATPRRMDGQSVNLQFDQKIFN